MMVGRRRIHLDFAPHDVLVSAEPALPQPVADDLHVRRPRPVVLGGKETPADRLGAQHGQQFGGHQLFLQLFRMDAIGQHRVRRNKSGDLLEDVVLPLPVQVVRRRHDVVVAAGASGSIPRPCARRPAFAVRQRAQQQVIGDRKDRQGGPDPQRQ